MERFKHISIQSTKFVNGNFVPSKYTKKLSKLGKYSLPSAKMNGWMFSWRDFIWFMWSSNCRIDFSMNAKDSCESFKVCLIVSFFPLWSFLIDFDVGDKYPCRHRRILKMNVVDPEKINLITLSLIFFVILVKKPTSFNLNVGDWV